MYDRLSPRRQYPWLQSHYAMSPVAVVHQGYDVVQVVLVDSDCGHFETL